MDRTTASRGKRTISLLLVLMLAFALVPGTASAVAADIYVDAQSGSDTTGDGSKGNPYQTIGWGNRVAVSGDTVWVESGRYDVGVEVAFPINLRAGVAVKAVDGYGSVTVDSGGTGRVFVMTDPTAGTMLQGLVVSGGWSPLSGGGVQVDYTLSSDLVGWPKFEDCGFDNNNVGSGSRGGAVHVRGNPGRVAPEFTRCYFSENQAPLGGAVSLQGKTSATFEKCYFSENLAEDRGGAIFMLDNFHTSLTDVTFSSNVAADGEGGAAYVGGGSIANTSFSVEGGRLRSNEASTSGNGGGGIYAHMTTVSIEGTEFDENSSVGDGGAVCLSDAKGHLTDLYVHHSTGDDGSALYFDGSTVATLTHSTVVDNTATDNYAVLSSGGQLSVFNSIFWGNSKAEDIAGVFSIFESCTEETAVVGPGVIHTDPEFKNPGDEDYRLENDSPCIDTAGSIESDGDDIDDQDRPQNGDGTVGAQPDMGCWERPALDVARYGGSNRYDTACQMAEAAFGSAETAIMASGEGFPDALSAAGLAGAYNAPLLLTAKDSVPSEVRAVLTSLGVDEVILVGGEGVISAAVRTWLEGQGVTVRRIAGTNRYATSAAVAEEIVSVTVNDFGDYPAAFFARGDDFPDALAVAPLAYAKRLPILLVQTDSLPTEIRDVMIDIDVELGYVCGGTGAVSATTKNAIDIRIAANGGPPTSSRWFGTDRYATAAAIAAGGEGEGFVDFQYVGIATGGNFPDALAGGMLAGVNDGVVLLTPTDSLATATRNTLLANQDVVLWAEVFGGTGVVNDSVKAAVDAALGW